MGGDVVVTAAAAAVVVVVGAGEVLPAFSYKWFMHKREGNSETRRFTQSIDFLKTTSGR